MVELILTELKTYFARQTEHLGGQKNPSARGQKLKRGMGQKISSP